MTQPISAANKGIAALTNTLHADQRSRQGTPGTAPAANAHATRTDQVNISAAGRFQQQAEDPRGGAQRVAANDMAQQPGNDRLASANPNRGERMKMLMSDMRAAFYSSSGDDNFNARLDFNGDGTINTSDLAMIRDKMSGGRSPAMTTPQSAPPSQDQTQPGMNPRAMMDSMRDAFFSRSGDDNFNASLDMNSDGVINAQDLGDLRRQMASTPASALSPSTAAPPSQEPMQSVDPNRAMMDSMRGAFFSRAGDDNFNADLDLNSDGVINAQDLGDLRRRMDAATTSMLSPSQGSSPSQEQTQPMTTAGTSTTSALVSDGPITEMDQLRNAFFTRAGEDGFNADVDFNGDGVINTQDLGIARMREQQPTDPVYPNVETPSAAAQTQQSASAAGMENPAVAQPVQEANTGPITNGGETQGTNATADARAALVEKLRDAFYSSTGDENFLAALDANGDGQINAADLAAMRARFESDGSDIA